MGGRGEDGLSCSKTQIHKIHLENTNRKKTRKRNKERRQEWKKERIFWFGQSRVENLNTISSHLQVTLRSHTAGMLKEKKVCMNEVMTQQPVMNELHELPADCHAATRLGTGNCSAFLAADRYVLL